MGCDFYTFYKLCIEYTKDRKTEIYTCDLMETKERHDWWSVDRDEDFEEWNDYLKRCESEKQRQLESIFRLDYPRVDLCVNGEWKCISTAKHRYLERVEKANIPVDAIVNVWKEGDSWAR